MKKETTGISALTDIRQFAEVVDIIRKQRTQLLHQANITQTETFYLA